MRDTNAARDWGRTLAVALLTPVALGACQMASGSGDPGNRTSYGRAVKVGNGTARTYITITNGVPEVGVALSEKALSGLPDEHAPGGRLEAGHTMFETALDLPAKNPTPFRHVVLNWNPGGHEPPGIYDVPHFDFHFYVIAPAERLAIDPVDPEFQRKAERKPDAQSIPARYVMPAPLAFARMGVHWVDTSSAELKGKRFTRTFIYGSWDGKVIFAEPMVTKAYLETKPNFSTTLPAPPRGRSDGYYPEGYSVRWDSASKAYRIALTGLPRG
ncbi:MAG TPA: DUF5602 domain-containing protein [Gemmatimonadaceae bacterium]|nr:DUF5602 domain-containing protein [Gemmatimonadaceae bacterium]